MLLLGLPKIYPLFIGIIRSAVFSSDFSPSHLLTYEVIITKIVMKFRGKLEVDLYKTGMLVEKMHTIIKILKI